MIEILIKKKTIEGYIIGYKSYDQNLTKGFFSDFIDKTVDIVDSISDSAVDIKSTVSDTVSNALEINEEIGLDIDRTGALKKLGESKILSGLDKITDLSNYRIDRYIKDSLKSKKGDLIYTNHNPGKLTKNLVKYLTNIKENSNDIFDSNIDEGLDLFKIIVEKLLSQTFIPLTKESIVIKYIEKNLIPFYYEVYKIVIENLMKLSNNYDRFIENQKIYVNMLHQFLEKSIQN